jgi:hypothetical protein
MIGIFSDIKGEDNVEIERLKEKRQQRLIEDEQKERNLIRKMFTPSQGGVSASAFLTGEELPSLKEQYLRMKSGEDDMFGQRRRTPDEIMRRFKPTTADPTDEETENDKTLYEEEIEEDEEGNEVESEDEAKTYFRNPRDISYKKNPVYSTNQLKREVLTSQDVSDLKSFMQQFRH